MKSVIEQRMMLNRLQMCSIMFKSVSRTRIFLEKNSFFIKKVSKYMCLHFIQIILWAVIQITNQEEIVSLENMTLDKLSAIGKPSILPGLVTLR